MTPGVYCTDEDLAVKAAADYPLICPRDQAIARGTDGAFVAGDVWTLASPTVDFTLAGAAAGGVVHLTRPTTLFRAPGESFAVSAVTPSGLLLRRKGQPPGAGLPPAPISGVSGVAFDVATCMPQILAAGADLERRFGVHDIVSGRRRVDLFDPTELRDAAVLSTLIGLYQAASRGTDSSGLTTNGRPDVWSAKARWLSTELEALLARVVVHWRPQALASETTRFTVRLER